MRGDQYQGGEDSLGALTYDDLNYLGFSDISKTLCDEILMTHNRVKTNWLSERTVKMNGPYLIKLQSREIITPLEDVTVQCVFDFYSMLTNQLPNMNVATVSFGAIMLHLGKI